MLTLTDLHIAMLDDAFIRNGWHGASLVPTLRKLTLEQLTHSGTHEGYTAWGIAIHCAYWKYRVRKRLLEGVLGERGPGRFSRSPADWPDLPEERSADAWRVDLSLLREEHELLKETVLRLSEEQLAAVDSRSGKPAATEIYSIAAHDAYHTAQIRNMGVPGL